MPPHDDVHAELSRLEQITAAQRGLLRELAADKGSLEGALRAAQLRHEELVERVPWIVVRVDEHRRYVDANRYFKQLMGVDDLLGAMVGSSGESTSWIAAVLAFAGDSSANQDDVEVEFEVDGERRHFVLGLSRTIAEGHISILGLDQSDRVVALERAEQALQVAEQASQAKSDFLAVMSHEIRTPLAGVLGTVELLANTELGSSQVELVDLLRRSGSALRGIIDDVLDLTKIESGNVEFEAAAFNPVTVIRTTLELFAAHARDSGLILRDVVGPEVPSVVVGDPTRLRQVLMNLVGNALKFTDEGEVAVYADGAAEDGRFRLRFEVRDTGIGMDEVQQRRIFDPFRQADLSTTRRFGGTGLGLSISKQLVEGMGGKLGLESAVGVGTTFRFEIPFKAHEPAEQVGHDQATIDSVDLVRALGLRLLVAEDNPINARIAEGYLRSLGCETVAVENGKEALRALQVDSHGFDAVLMDINMPVMDGLTATAAIRELETEVSSIPVVAVTANAIQGDIDRCLANGMDDWLGKPFTRDQLAETLLGVIASDRWRDYRARFGASA